MLLTLPPELLLLLVDYLGYESHWRLARTCTTLWALLGSTAKLRRQYAVFFLCTPGDSDASISKLFGHPFWQNRHPLWQKGRAYIEFLELANEPNHFMDPHPLFWVGRTHEDIDEAVRVHPQPESSCDQKLRPSHFSKLRGLYLPVRYCYWIPMVNLWSEALHIQSPFNIVENLTIGGVTFGFLEVREIFALPALKHLRIEGPRVSWDSTFENSAASMPKFYKVETLQLVDTVISVGTATHLIASCKALKCFAYWQRRPPRSRALIDGIWDSRAIINALREHQSRSLKVLSLYSTSEDGRRSPWASLKGLSQLESLTCKWLYIMPEYLELLHEHPHMLREDPTETYHLNPVPLSEILPTGLKFLRLEQKSTGLAHKRDTPWDVRMLKLKEHLESPHSTLDEICLPFHDQTVQDTAKMHGVRYKVVSRDKHGNIQFNRDAYAYQDADGDWIDILD